MSETHKVKLAINFLCDVQGIRIPEWNSLRSQDGLLLLVVVERLPETDPDIEQPQTAADAAEIAVGNERAQSGKREQ